MAGEISVGENSWENSARGKHWFGKKWLGEFQQGGNVWGDYGREISTISHLQTAFDPILSIRKNEHLVFGGIF